MRILNISLSRRGLNSMNIRFRNIWKQTHSIFCIIHKNVTTMILTYLSETFIPSGNFHCFHKTVSFLYKRKKAITKTISLWCTLYYTIRDYQIELTQLYYLKYNIVSLYREAAHSKELFTTVHGLRFIVLNSFLGKI